MAKTFSVKLPKGHYLLLLKNKDFPEYYWATGYTLNRDDDALYSYGASQDTHLVQVWELPNAEMAAKPGILLTEPTLELMPVWSKDKS